MNYTVTTFYCFKKLPAPELQIIKTKLQNILVQNQIKGTILIAPEGINATICATDSQQLQNGVTQIKAHLGIEFPQTISTSPIDPFPKAKVRIKPALVKLLDEKRNLSELEAHEIGKYVKPEDWNELIANDDVIIIDARNLYETHLGSFKGAVDPKTRKFNHLSDFTKQKIPKDAKIATYCTGGIRCERYSAWLKAEGYENVYHLEGGILRYLVEVSEEQSLWQGSCYVFDDRVAVKHGLEVDETATSCLACGHSLIARELQSEKYMYGKSCPHCETYPPSNFDLLEQHQNIIEKI
jgi:UPF0176 protein